MQLNWQRIRRITPEKLRDYATYQARRGLCRIGVAQSRWYRQLRTNNFRLRYLATGERNGYGQAPFWITLDWQDADFTLDVVKSGRLPFADQSG